MPTHIRILLIPALLAGSTALPVTVAAQARSDAALVGRVLDAGTSQPVSGAAVTLEPLPGGLVIDTRAASTAVASRTILTGADGAYRFGELPPGRYRLHVQRLGYRASVVEAEVRRPVDAALSVALELEPIALRPVLVEDRAEAPFQRASNARLEPEAARAESERLRQRAFLTPDSRALTYADVMDGVTLGEADVFRALQRFAGVATRDDYSAELWSRGAPWSQTRVTFDGLPLFNPVHAVGVLSAVTPEVLGVVFYHPGARPVSLADGAAAVVDLRSRSGGGDGAVRGVADASMASVKLALEQRITEGRAAWLVAARRSYFDVMTRGLDWLSLGDVDLPYSFHDVTTRLDLALGRSMALEASALWEEDRLFGDVQNVVARTRARWGNSAGRVTLNAASATVRSSHTIGVSRYDARVREYDAIDRSAPGPWSEPQSENELLHVRVAGDITPAERTSGERARWMLGYELALRSGLYDGPLPRYHPVQPDTNVRIHREREHRTGALWAEAWLTAGPKLTVNPGLRIETGDAVNDAPALRIGPALAVRWMLSEQTALSAAASRSWQYIQAIALAGPSPHPAFHASQFWLIAGRDAPAVRADVWTLGIERWFGAGWLASATGYVRNSSGVALPDPDSGSLLRRPLFVVGENDARGIDLSVRRVGARWSTSLGYSYGISDMKAEGFTYPSAADRRHALDILAAIRVAGPLRLASAFTYMTGAPYTRAMSRASAEDCALFGFGCAGPAGAVQAPNAQRTPDYRSLDVSVQWSRRLSGVELSAYAQVRNVLDRDNATTYSGTSAASRPVRPTGFERVLEDHFEQGLPRLPLIGARITF